MMKRIDPRLAVAFAATMALGACVAPPPGPMIPVAPGPGKSFDAFNADDATCRQFAEAQTAPQAAAANNQGVGTAILGTALGAGLGAAIGGGRGAAIGAASGAVVGTAAGANGAAYAQGSVQQHYDVAYAQCMQAHGNQMPGFGPPPPGMAYEGPPPGMADEGPPPGMSPYDGPPPPGAPLPPPPR